MMPEIETDDGLDDILAEEGMPKPDTDSDKEQPKPDEQPTPEGDSKEVVTKDEAPSAETTDTDTEGSDATAPEPEKAEDKEKAEDTDVAGKKKKKRKDEEKPETFKYKGKEYSKQDLVNDPELFNKIVTAANQQTHYQDLYGEQKTKIEEIERKILEREAAEQAWAEQQAQAAAAGQRPVIKPEHVAAMTKEAVGAFVKDGWVEEDFAELYPNTMASMAYLRDNFLGRLFQVEAALDASLRHTFQNERQAQTRSTWDQLNSAIDHVASEGGVFAPLSDNQTRINFLRRLQETVNPEVEQLISKPEIIRNLWVAENQEAFIRAASARRAEEEQRAASQRRNAVGEGGGVQRARQTPKGPEPGVEEGWADLERDNW